MTVLNRRYEETGYRYFSNIVMRWLIDRTLASNTSLQKSEAGIEISLSGFFTKYFSDSWIKSDSEFVRNLIRYWTEYLMLKEDGITTWANNWLHYTSRIPTPAKVEWDTWESMFSALLADLYIAYWNNQFSNGVSPTTLKEFWTALWFYYARVRGIDVESTLKPVKVVIDKVVDEREANLSELTRISDVLEEMCTSANVAWYGVPQPIWLDSLRVIEYPQSWSPERIPNDWDVPLVVLASVSGKTPTFTTIATFLENEHNLTNQLLVSHLETVYADIAESYEFLFPLQNHRLQVNSEVPMGKNSKVLGVSESLAVKLTKSSGIGPRPQVGTGDAFIVVAGKSKQFNIAVEEARAEVERIQNILRIADAGFKWDTSFYYFWTVGSPSKEPEDLVYIAERRDAKQLYPDLTEEWLIQVRDWVSKVEKTGSELGKATSIALKWQGLSRDQNGNEGKFLCLWIALERLGGGNYEYKTVIPHVAGSLWRYNMWRELPVVERIRCVYYDRKRMSNIISDLAKMRNDGVVHRGEFSNKKDVRYATWFLEHLVNDLIRYMLQINAMNHDVNTHAELMEFLDKTVGLL